MPDTALTSIFGSTESLVAGVVHRRFPAAAASRVHRAGRGGGASSTCSATRTSEELHGDAGAAAPLIVQMVITLVNGNLGAGIAVMGVFNLVRFRSIPGSAEGTSAACFWPWPSALATGIYFIVLAVLFTIIIGYRERGLHALSPFGKQKEPEKTLKITIP